MGNATVLHHATVLKNKSEETIKKEVALNLLQDLLTLYIYIYIFIYLYIYINICVCVRSFSLANDIQQAYQIQQSRARARSLKKRVKQHTHVVT